METKTATRLQLLFQFSYLHRKLLEECLRPLCKKYKLSASSFSIIVFLYSNPSKNLSRDICTYTDLRRGNVSILVEKLTKMGYIRQDVDDADRRKHYLTLTEKSVALLAEVEFIFEEHERVITKGISRELLHCGELLLEKIHCNLVEELKRLSLWGGV
ncbi:MAG: winged helix DNA-binding protein [Treponemataceae bacterium]|nr:winged helix DNA-binding protein [Treponemataceae bacterium]